PRPHRPVHPALQQRRRRARREDPGAGRAEEVSDGLAVTDAGRQALTEVGPIWLGPVSSGELAAKHGGEGRGARAAGRGGGRGRASGRAGGWRRASSSGATWGWAQGA